ncbi:MAG TPA: hypothetical protein PKJ08_00180 [Candidatus Cloacimonadota bacterium]|nr:hypothetical protein [Candidatus Cloacimonadota bacterium]
MKNIRLLILISLLLVAFTAFAQEIPDIASPSISGGEMAIEMPVSPVKNIIQNSVVELLALVFSGLLSLAVVYLNRLLKLNMTNAQIIEKIVETKEMSTLTNRQKKDIVINRIAQDKKLSKWVKILHGSIGAGVDIVYQTLVKRRK